MQKNLFILTSFGLRIKQIPPQSFQQHLAPKRRAHFVVDQVVDKESVVKAMINIQVMHPKHHLVIYTH